MPGALSAGRQRAFLHSLDRCQCLHAMLGCSVYAGAGTPQPTVSMRAPAPFAAAIAAASSSGWTGPPTASRGWNGWSGRSALGRPCTLGRHQVPTGMLQHDHSFYKRCVCVMATNRSRCQMGTWVERGTSGGSPSAAAPFATFACMAGGMAAAAIALAARQCLHQQRRW